jgi:hypothetical protein
MLKFILYDYNNIYSESITCIIAHLSLVDNELFVYIKSN